METVIEIDMRAYTQNMTKEFEAKHDFERWIRRHPAFRRDLIPGSVPEMEEDDAFEGIMATDAPGKWDRQCGVAHWSRAGRSSRQRGYRLACALEAIDGFGDDAVDGVDEAGRK